MQAPGGSASGRAWRSRITLILGVGLLVAAGFALASQRGVVLEAWRSVGQSPWWQIALVLLLPLANYVVVSTAFWVTTRRAGPVPLSEMLALIGMAWALNFVPLRVGAVTRVAYHKVHHGISVSTSLLIMGLGLACGLMAAVLGVVVSMVVGPEAELATIAIALVGPTAAGVLVALAAGGRTIRVVRDWRLSDIGWTFVLRWIDFVLWAVRYALLFDLIGHPISLPSAVALAAVCQLALAVPLVGNGLGVREWLVALTASNLPASVVSSAGRLTTAVGLAADLVNRAAEIVVAALVGMVSIACLIRWRGTWRTSDTAAGPETPPPAGSGSDRH